MSIKSEVVAQFVQVAEQHEKQLAALSDDLPLTDSGLDSLCLAVVVARLEDTFEIDPFTAAETAGFPVTFGDFVKFYEDALTVPYSGNSASDSTGRTLPRS
jgi:acyl carrier protein